MRKLSLFLIFTAIILIGGYFYYLPMVRWHKAAQSAGGYPYQIGLTKAVITKCVTTGTPPTCVGAGVPPDPIATPLCNTKGPGICTAYSVVSGLPAGGMGTNALFLTTSVAKAGLMPGGQLIAGGMTMTEMDSGVLASAGGCYGCGLGKADSNLLDRIASVAVYIIAGIRDKIK